MKLLRLLQGKAPGTPQQQLIFDESRGVIEAEIFENQRWVPGGGWSERFLGVADPKTFSGGGPASINARAGSIFFGDLEPLLPPDCIWYTNWNVDLRDQLKGTHAH